MSKTDLSEEAHMDPIDIGGDCAQTQEDLSASEKSLKGILEAGTGPWALITSANNGIVWVFAKRTNISINFNEKWRNKKPIRQAIRLQQSAYACFCRFIGIELAYRDWLRD